MIKCPHCGEMTDASIPICTNCGMPITDEIELSETPKEEIKIVSKKIAKPVSPSVTAFPTKTATTPQIRAPSREKITKTTPKISPRTDERKPGTIVPVKALERALKGDHKIEDSEEISHPIESPFTPIDESELPSEEVLMSSLSPRAKASSSKAKQPLAQSSMSRRPSSTTKIQSITEKEDIEFEIEEPTEEEIPLAAASVTSTITCPKCGHIYTPDNFEYPEYVYAAMGRARMEAAIELIKEKRYTEAIELLNKAKKIYEHANIEDGIKNTIEKINESYISMGEIYRKQGEQLLKQKQYEDAIVQFNYARSYYIKADAEKRVNSMDNKIQETYQKLGEELQKEAEQEVKQGNNKIALALYQKAINIYLKINETKKIKEIEKKMKKL